MSEAARRRDPATRLPLAALAGGSAFRSDVRFLREAAAAALGAELEEEAVAAAEDPIAAAFAEGRAAGLAEARAAAARAAAAEAEARDGLALGFARIDAALEERLRARLRESVVALCERAIAPLALDEVALVRRIARIAAMLARADDEIVIRLNPDDLALLAPSFRADWQVRPDPALERGAVRAETATGGVEDGPEQWRRAIAEALAGC